jgi:hypothetical protein
LGVTLQVALSTISFFALSLIRFAVKQKKDAVAIANAGLPKLVLLY